MNYIKFAQDNQKIYNYKIIKINKMNNLAIIKCNECGAIKQCQLKSLYKSFKNGNIKIHNQFCSKYYLDICRKEFGNDIGKCFHDFYRRSHERCCNPKNKNYEKYKGKFKFKDFCDFFNCCYDIFKEALNKYYYKELTIDRIDSKKGYEEGNIRFVSMKENLQNKPYVKPVRMINIKTGEIINGVSFGDLARKYKHISYASSLHRALKKKILYKKEWKLEYIEA